MMIGMGSGLIVVGLVVALDLLTVNLGWVDDEALGAILLVAGLLILGLSLLYAPPNRRVMYVQTSRDDGTTR